MIKRFLDEGKKLSDVPFLVMEVLQQVIYSGNEMENKFLLDGYPSSI
jgi:hypothetical protein